MLIWAFYTDGEGARQGGFYILPHSDVHFLDFGGFKMLANIICARFLAKTENSETQNDLLGGGGGAFCFWASLDSRTSFGSERILSCISYET